MTANARLYAPCVALPIQAADATEARMKALLIQQQLHDLVRAVNRPRHPGQDRDVLALALLLADTARDLPDAGNAR